MNESVKEAKKPIKNPNVTGGDQKNMARMTD